MGKSRVNRKSTTGQQAEKLAEAYLSKQGQLSLVARNYRCRLGELDLVMAKADQLVFIEVKFRSKQDFEEALFAVTPAKQKKLCATAALFLAKHSPLYDKHWCRFDVLAISGSISQPNYQWIQGAFEEQ